MLVFRQFDTEVLDADALKLRVMIETCKKEVFYGTFFSWKIFETFGEGYIFQ
jgi:hypothetical protein